MSYTSVLLRIKLSASGLVLFQFLTTFWNSVLVQCSSYGGGGFWIYQNNSIIILL